MRRLVLGAAMLCLVAILCMLWGPQDMVHFQGHYVKNRPDKAEVSALLARLQTNVMLFLERAPAQDPRIQRIKQRWSGTLAEIDSDAQEEGSLAYSLNKSSIHVCVRAPDGSLADDNTAMFVLLHELAHLATLSYGHTPEFWETMKYVMEVAEKTGVYTYVDHGAQRVTLCNRVLGPSPLTCVRQKTCGSALATANQN